MYFKMSEVERIQQYEQDKRELISKNLSDREYQEEIKRIADKWRI